MDMGGVVYVYVDKIKSYVQVGYKGRIIKYCFL